MKSVDDVRELIDRANAVPSAAMARRTLNDAFKAQEESKRTNAAGSEPSLLRIALGGKAGRLAAAFLIISSLLACLFLSRRVIDLKAELEQTRAQARRDMAIARQDIALAPVDDSATINFYLEEHKDLVARHAAFSSAAPQPAQVHVNRRDILYYEFLDDEPQYMSPGIIVRGPSSERQIGSSGAPVISNGHTLSLSEARKTAGFNLVARSWLHPGYKLGEIRRIEGRETLQLLYTDGINSVSLFEQPLDGQSGLSAKDFREYAVYSNKGQAGGTILAWRDDELSCVLIGNTDLSQLMDMAQSIGAAN